LDPHFFYRGAGFSLLRHFICIHPRESAANIFLISFTFIRG